MSISLTGAIVLITVAFHRFKTPVLRRGYQTGTSSNRLGEPAFYWGCGPYKYFLTQTVLTF
jgi:hypothetical protein